MEHSLTLAFDNSELVTNPYFRGLVIKPPTFDLPALRKDVRTIARRAWIDRTRSEYIGVMVARRLWALLVDVNAPADVQELGLKMMLDEQRHTRLCMAAAQALGADPEVVFDFSELQQGRTQESEVLQLLEMAVGTYAIGECTALELVVHAYKEVPASGFRDVLKVIAADEVLHGRIGMALLEQARSGKTMPWLPWPNDTSIRDIARAHVDAMLQRDVVEPDEAELFEDPKAALQLKQLGIPDARRFKAKYRAILEETIAENFKRLGITL